MNIRHIRQEDPNGCLAACVAMVTGAAYDDVRRWFTDRGCRFDAAAGGITHFDVQAYLGDHEFAYALKYRWLCANHPRTPWPCEPFAPVHVLGVVGGGRHGIVMLANGDIFDPAIDGVRRLSDYPDVSYILGVWRIAQ